MNIGQLHTLANAWQRKYGTTEANNDNASQTPLVEIIVQAQAQYFAKRGVTCLQLGFIGRCLNGC